MHWPVLPLNKFGKYGSEKIMYRADELWGGIPRFVSSEILVRTLWTEQNSTSCVILVTTASTRCHWLFRFSRLRYGAAIGGVSSPKAGQV